jgi:hypothetical protein
LFRVFHEVPDWHCQNLGEKSAVCPRQRSLGRRVPVDAGEAPMLVASCFVSQPRKILQLVQTAGEGSERGFLEVFQG